MKVKEIMTRKVISVKPEDNALDSLNTLLMMQISGLPVIDEKGIVYTAILNDGTL